MKLMSCIALFGRRSHRKEQLGSTMRAVVLALGMPGAVAALGSPPQAPPQSLTLKGAEALAIRNHPRLQAASLNAAAAEQARREVTSSYYPAAAANLTAAGALPDSRIAAGGLNNPIVLNRYSNGVEVSQLITDFGRTSNLAASARLKASAANASTQQTEQDVLLAADQAYFGVLRAQAVLGVAEDTVKTRQIVADRAAELQKNKLKSGLDVKFAEVDLAQAKLLLVQAQNGVNASYAQLANALGLPGPEPFNLTDTPLPAAPPPDATDLIAQALQDRPDLASARFSRDAAVRFARAERDLWMPTIAAAGAAGVTPLHQAALTDRYAAAGINVEIPIFNGFLFSARHQEANLRAQAEGQDLRDLANRVARDVRTAWLDANTAFERLDITAQLVAEATDALDLAQGRYKLGLSSIVELSQAQLNLTQAQLDQASAKYEYLDATANLDYQTGALH